MFLRLRNCATYEKQLFRSGQKIRSDVFPSNAAAQDPAERVQLVGARIYVC